MISFPLSLIRSSRKRNKSKSSEGINKNNYHSTQASEALKVCEERKAYLEKETVQVDKLICELRILANNGG
tara:strand:+ start:190 stop:402 length:213 start_codon:yes stop_codon:yes gene_type:complete